MIILSSSSPARKKLLETLQIPFETHSPDIDETAKENESTEETVARLSQEKAQACCEQFKDALIIGSDQLVCIDSQSLGKPHTHEQAINQLKLSSDKILYSYTAITLLNSKTQNQQTRVITYQVKFKKLDNETIDRYLRLDTPYQCAGSIRAEGLGVTLFEWMRGDDPSALTGLPLIALTEMLQNEGYDVLKHYIKTQS